MAISRIPSAGVSTDTLTAADLAPNSVDTSELADNSVTNRKLADEGTLIQSAIKKSIHKSWILGS